MWVETIEVARHDSSPRDEFTSDPKVESHVELRLKSAWMATRSCTHEERFLVKTIDKEYATEQLAVVVCGYRTYPKTKRCEVISRRFAHKGSVKVSPAGVKEKCVGVRVQ